MQEAELPEIEIPGSHDVAKVEEIARGAEDEGRDQAEQDARPDVWDLSQVWLHFSISLNSFFSSLLNYFFVCFGTTGDVSSQADVIVYLGDGLLAIFVPPCNYQYNFQLS